MVNYYWLTSETPPAEINKVRLCWINYLPLKILRVGLNEKNIPSHHNIFCSFLCLLGYGPLFDAQDVNQRIPIA